MKRIVGVFVVIVLAFWIAFSLSVTLSQEESPTWEVYFSPKGGATEAIIRELGESQNLHPCSSLLLHDRKRIKSMK
jgi:hypothetical protein